jgi:hypothetical protein
VFECEGVVRGQGEGFFYLKEYVAEKGLKPMLGYMGGELFWSQTMQIALRGI